MTARVLVAGGGVIGLATAFRLAGRGADVTVVDPAPGRGASWVAGGMLAPVAEAYPGEEDVLRLGLASRDRFAAFAAELTAAGALDAGLTARGTLVVARDADDAGELGVLHTTQLGYGLAVERLSSRDARRLEPALAPTVRGALWLADDHQVDNRAFVDALLAACRAVGVAFVADHVARLTGTRLTTVGGTELAGDAVVAATGSWVPPIELGGAPVALPVRPVKGQIVRVRGVPGAVLPTRTVRGPGVYVIPRETGEIAIGATSEERGYDTTVTAGGVHDLLHDAWELLPGLAEATFVEAVAGLRPGTPDNAPLIGRLGPAGPVVATGHYRHGVLLAPVTADAVASLVLDGVVDPLVAPFDPARFAEVAAACA